MRKVEVFATLLTALDRIGQLPVMKELLGEITILEAGYRELSVKSGLICTRELRIVLLSGFMWRR